MQHCAATLATVELLQKRFRSIISVTDIDAPNSVNDRSPRLVRVLATSYVATLDEKLASVCVSGQLAVIRQVL